MKLPPHTIYVEDYDEFREFIQAWIDGHYQFMVVVGPAGTGKSETIERLMYMAKGKPGGKWAYLKGRLTSLRLYHTLYDFRLLPIVSNDVDLLMEDKTNISLMKCVCDTSAIKTVQWSSTHPLFKSLPSSFESISPVLVITNSWDKSSANVTALLNRATVIHFAPTALEVHREVGQDGWFDERDIWEFIGRNLHLMTRPDFRFYVHARNHKRAGRDWKDLTLRMLENNVDRESGETQEEKEKLIFVARLLADPHYDQHQTPEAEREKVFALAFPKGGSRATYHRFKKKLLDRRGHIDPQVVQQMTWHAPPLVVSQFDEKQQKRRAALEAERLELEKAGGVYADEDEDA